MSETLVSRFEIKLSTYSFEQRLKSSLQPPFMIFLKKLKSSELVI